MLALLLRLNIVSLMLRLTFMPCHMQERRFAQLEDAMAAREAKREAYLVHRLEASAAEKIAEHRRSAEES